MSQHTATYPETYGRQWSILLLFVALLGGAYWYFNVRQIPYVSPVMTVTDRPADWYMLVRMPEFTVNAVNFFSARQKFASWLEAFLEAGYQPMLMSEIQAHLAAGKRLPEKATVLMFEPGYHKTYDVVAPILSKYRVPAVWVTEAEALKQPDRRYVSVHQSNSMRRSGMWDVGHYDGEQLVIQGREDAQFVLGKGGRVWTPESGRTLINKGAPAGQQLNRLDTNVNWTAQEFIDRLGSEVPIRDEARLTIKPIQSRLWGIALNDAKEPVRFDLKAQPDKRAATMYWLGTRGLSDMEINVEASSITGEFWVLMRYDDLEGQGVCVGFSGGRVFVEEEHGHVRSRLGTFWMPAGIARQISARITLEGTHLKVGIDGKEQFHTVSISVPATARGMVRTTAYEKVRGAANAESIQLRVKRLESSPDSASRPLSGDPR